MIASFIHHTFPYTHQCHTFQAGIGTKHWKKLCQQCTNHYTRTQAAGRTYDSNLRKTMRAPPSLSSLPCCLPRRRGKPAPNSDRTRSSPVSAVTSLQPKCVCMGGGVITHNPGTKMHIITGGLQSIPFAGD